MKNTKKVPIVQRFGIIALAAVIGFTFIGCPPDDNGDNSSNPQTATYTGTSGGATYTLKITENTARYAAQSGDAYELTVGAKKSVGKVDSAASGVLTLKPSNAAATFTAAVSGSSLTALNGTITWTDDTTAAAPGAMTGGNPGDGGTFTLTGIPSEYNGKYAFFSGSNPIVFGAQNLDLDTSTVTLCVISNGSVSLPMWIYKTSIERYSGNDTLSQTAGIGIYDTQTIILSGTGPTVGGLQFNSVTCANGSATKSWNEGTWRPVNNNGDGNMTWTAVTDSTFDTTLVTSRINAIAYGNNKFVVGGTDGKMATSTDGVTWTAVTYSTFGASDISAIAYGNGRFVAGGSVGKMATSTDGVTWTAVEYSTFGTDTIRAISYGNNKFVATAGTWGVTNTSKMATSMDGTTWTAVTNSTFGTSAVHAIAYGNNKFVAVGRDGKMAYSLDGTTWTAISDSTLDTRIIAAIAYGSNGSTVNRFVAGNNYNAMAYSSDGITWIAVSNSVLTGTLNAIAYGGNKFVVGDYYGKTAYSSDGVTWTDVTDSEITSTIYAIAYGNDKFVAVGSGGKIAYSSGN